MNIKDITIIYVTRDAERAIGIEEIPGQYEVITNTEKEEKGDKKIDNTKEIFDTWELLEQPKTIKKINATKNPAIIVFKNTKKIESICSNHGWKLLNPSAELASKVEEKISQVEWLDDLAEYLPETEITIGKKLQWRDESYIVQFNRAHTGSGTMLIESEKDIEKIKKDFPDRPVRISKYIHGPVFTINAVVGAKNILLGNISYQITGLSPFTNNTFATIGNDWGFADHLLKPEQKKQFEKLVTNIGKKLRNDGWHGLFGVDVILEKTSGRIYLLEINARQSANVSYESQLQSFIEDDKQNIFESHLLALLDSDIPDNLPIVNSGSQIILRNQKGKIIDAKKIISELKKIGIEKIIKYTNKKPGTDALRIQTNKNIIKAHNELNELGIQISRVCK